MSENEKLVFLFGSETGNSESICKKLHNDAVNQKGYTEAVCMSLNNAVSKKILEEQTNEETASSLCMVIVVSTTGEGEPPENASRFRRWLRNCKSNLFRTRYAVLALGDSNYNNFCAAGKYIDSKLSEFGGFRFYARGEADDGVDLNVIVEPWTERLWDHLQNKTNAIGHEPFSISKQHFVDFSVPQEVAIIYANAHNVCAAFALFLYERIAELGGKANVFPIQYFDPSRMAQEAEIVFFIVSTDADEHTLCEQCAAASHIPPPLGTFSEVLLPSDSTTPSASSTAIQEWLSKNSLSQFASVCLALQPEKILAANQLSQAIKNCMTKHNLQLLNKAFLKPAAEGGVSSIAGSDSDLKKWCEAVLDHLPGVTASEDKIKQSVGWFFDSSVGSAVRLAQASHLMDLEAASQRESKRSHHRHHHSPVVKPEKETHADKRDRDLVKDILTPLVILYSEGCACVKAVAKELGELAESNHLHCVVSDLSNIRRVGFPRRATFIFVVSGEITKSFSNLLKSIPKITKDKKSFENVKFAILGINQSSKNEKFNAFALELETLLLRLRANKIHCTGLVDADHPEEFSQVVQSFKSNLWGAIMNPTTSVAYLDAGSPNIARYPAFPTADSDLEREGSFHAPHSPVLGHPREGSMSFTGASNYVWESIAVLREAASQLSVAFLYSSPGMSKTMATIAMDNAVGAGFNNVILRSFSKYYEVDTKVYDNWILFCEATPDGLSNGGARLRRFLQSPSRQPDELSHIQYSVLGLGNVNSNITHPAFGWSVLMTNLQANCVFPVAVMGSMSQIHSIGIPWTECVLASLSMLAQHAIKGKETTDGKEEKEPEALSDLKSILFLYGSATGVTESIARYLHREAMKRGYQSRIGSFRNFNQMNFLSTPTIVFLTSTINGNYCGFPKNGESFVKYLFNQNPADASTLLAGTRFAVVGTGNEELYAKSYCQAAVLLDRRLQEVGGSRLLPVGKINVAGDLTESVESWKRQFFQTLDRVVKDEANLSALVETVKSGSQLSSEFGSAALPLLSKGREEKVYIVTSCPPNSAVPGIAVYLQERLKEVLETVDLKIIDTGDLTKMNLRKQPHILIFILALGDTEESSLAGSSFIRLLKQSTTPKDIFHQVRYCVLSVLNTNASSYLPGRQLDNRLEEFGATRFYARGEAIDSYSLQKSVERWVEGLMTAVSVLHEQIQLEGTMGVMSQAPSDANLLSIQDQEESKTESSMLTRYAGNRIPKGSSGTGEAVISQWRYLTDGDQKTVHMVLQVSPETVWYPGQTISFLPWNSDEVVDRFLRHFKENGDSPFHPLSIAGEEASCFVNSPVYAFIDFPASLRKVLTQYVSLRVKSSNSREILALLKCYAASKEEEEEIASLQLQLSSTPTELMDILERFPHLKPPIRHLIEHLPTLKPREYSIASSKSKNPQHLSICFKILPKGLCTNWLHEQCWWSSGLDRRAPSTALGVNEWQRVVRRNVIPFALRPTTDFRMPKDPLIPLILIGPGLGVNPFMAFLEEREVQLSQRRSSAGGALAVADDQPLCGTIDLFFGCRKRYEDFLFKEELSNFFQSGVLSSITVAFSREANDGAFWYGGCYVQDKLIESALVISELITQRSAYVYVCGDIQMGKEVHQILIDIIHQTTGKDEKGATEYIEYIMSQGRYTRDVW